MMSTFTNINLFTIHIPFTPSTYSRHSEFLSSQGFFQEMCQGGGGNLAMKNMWGASLKHYRL